MRNLLAEHALILMEGAITEQMRRAGHFSLHPALSISTLIYDERGRCELERLYKDYLQVALDADLPFIMFTPTWRANHERVEAAGAPLHINADAVRFMKEIRDDRKTGKATILIGGLMGCKNDCYRPQEGLSAAEAEHFHAWQIDQLATAGVDFLIAETLPNVNEATGIAQAMSKTGLPYIISFVINRQGLILDGTDLSTAIGAIDAGTDHIPTGYMINCAYPTFLRTSRQPEKIFHRLIGFQANASSLDQTDLDGAEILHTEAVSEWGAEMLQLHRTYGLKLLGGCCGTGVEHLKYIVEN